MRYARSEWQSNRNSHEFHKEIQLALRSNGFVIFDSVLDEPLVERLRKALLQRIDEYVFTVLDGRPQTRYHLPLRLTEPFIDNAVIRNPLVMPTLVETLGDDLAISYYGSDTAGPGSTYQEVHIDGRPLFPELPLNLPTYGVVVNFPLVDFHEENGPLEIWPSSSHHLAGIDPQVGSAILGSTPVVAPAGSLIMRDLRLWHRGTPNRTTQIRPMIAVVYSRPWYRFGPSEVGYPEPRIRRDDYDHWPAGVRTLFRFATRDSSEDFSGETGLGMVPDRKQDALIKERIGQSSESLTRPLSTTATTR
jgi:Phytanoyl-CoA dioxygenase (PhyH)